MSPSKPADCELQSCAQEERINENESAIGALTREISTVAERIGYHEDSIAGKEGSGLIGAFDKLAEQVDELRIQQAKDMAAIKAELAALREEQTSRREAPGKILRWAVTILPLLAALVGAVSWSVNHLRFVP